MTLGLILFIVAVLISLSAFVYFLVKTAQKWGVLHSTLLSILFIESWVFFYFTAAVQYERVRATREAFRFRQEAETAVERGKALRFGSVDAPYDSLEAVLPVQGQLERLTIDRGRVWRQLEFAGASAGGVQLVIKGPTRVDELTGEATAGPAPDSGASLPENLVVYAFEENLTEDQQPLPVFYLGEFRVVKTDRASGQVSLEVTLPLNPLQQDRISKGSATWTLYEMLPIDSHTAFSAPGSEPTDEAIFGRPDEENIRNLLGGVPEAVLQSYLRDGQKATDDDPPETIWEQINLLANYQVDVDSDQSADATVSGYFDQMGRSIDIRLKRDGPVSLSPGDLKDNRIVVPENVARDLIARGAAERVQRIFVRPLNDYLGIFNRTSSQRFELESRRKYYQEQNKLIEQSNQAGQEMLAFRQREKQRLTADLSGFQKELQFLKTSVEQADQELEKLKTDLSNLYRAIQEYHQRLLAGG